MFNKFGKIEHMDRLACQLNSFSLHQDVGVRLSTKL